jgi:hypothetical protein
VCLKIHKEFPLDGHAQVQSHFRTFSREILGKFGFHSQYFISAVGWPAWCEKLKIDSIVDYLKTVRKEIVWDSFREISKGLQEEQLLSPAGCQTLYERIFAHDVGAVHLVRIPNTFWLLYSTKHNITFEEAIRTANLTSDMKLNMGKLIIQKVREAYPSWEPIKTRVPGEAFEAVNYPPEVLPIVAKAMEEWGVQNRCWR